MPPLPKIDLNVGQEYSVEIYPGKEVVTAKYTGEAELEGFGDRHLFISEGKDKSYVYLDDWWLIKKEDGTLSYIRASSFSITRTNKDKINKLLNSENIHNRDLGSRVLRFLEGFVGKIE